MDLVEMKTLLSSLLLLDSVSHSIWISMAQLKAGAWHKQLKVDEPVRLGRTYPPIFSPAVQPLISRWAT
jgi:hypothetical protein